VTDRWLRIFPEQLPQAARGSPRAQTVVGDLPLRLGQVDAVSARHGLRLRAVATHQPGHPLGLEKVGDDERDADDVPAATQLLHEAGSAGKVQDRRERCHVGSQEVEAEAPREEAEGLANSSRFFGSVND
jgi:hypothetical protein